jgi:hypothetical protein
VTRPFGCIEDAKTFCRSFFDRYNQDHHHAGIGLMTPEQVHYGQTDEVYEPARKPSTAPSNPIQNASSKSRQNHRSNQPRPGSTRQPKGNALGRCLQALRNSLDADAVEPQQNDVGAFLFSRADGGRPRTATKFFRDIRLRVKLLDWPRHPGNPPRN